jgi:maleylacetoacetate isomerase/maleylpyruvate isomerase
MNLYSYWRSTAAYRVRIALNLKQLPYDITNVDLVKNGGEQHSEAYQKLNPNQLVPTLVDGDVVLSQSSAIIEYLEESYPGSALLPKQAYLRAQIRAMAQTVACDIHPLNNLRVLQYLKKKLSAEQQQLDNWYQHWVQKGFAAIEKTLQSTSGNYCFDNDVTLADVFLVPQVYNANRFKVDINDFPLIQKINNNCLQLDAFHKASPEQQKDAAN